MRYPAPPSLSLQTHKNVWLRVASERGRGLYLRFTNMVVNDVIFVLDEALKALKVIKEIETLKESTEEWNQLTP